MSDGITDMYREQRRHLKRDLNATADKAATWRRGLERLAELLEREDQEEARQAQQLEAFAALVAPVQEWLAAQANPHTTIIIDAHGAALTGTLMFVPGRKG